jgi:hypothetical protein
MPSKKPSYFSTRKNTQKDYSYTDVEDTSVIKEEVPFKESTLETIDTAMFRWINEEMNVSAKGNTGFKKVPALWVSAERAYQIKKNKGLRDQDGTLIFPLITVERTSVVKSLSKKGTIYNSFAIQDVQGGSITIARQINQEKTSNFANADSYRKRGTLASPNSGINQRNFPRKNKKVVYETVTIPVPVYLDIQYDIYVRTEYQQQMNEIITPFFVKTGSLNYFNIFNEGHRFEAFIQEDYAQENNASSLDEEERQYQTKITVKVLGYVIGADTNQEQPRIVKRQNAVEVKIPRERVIVGDIPDHIDKRGFYRD